MKVDKHKMQSIDGKTVLITGGTGSFGKQFIQEALTRYQPKRLIVFSRDELKQHELRELWPDSRLEFFLGDVRDCDRLRRAFQAEIDIVIHAAALKQVPACEYNPFEAIKTNVLGAKNIIDASIDCAVPKVLALSTDKAVNPVNLYGATKLCAEKLFVQGNSYAGSKNTRFSCVRYGNVLGSRGSVVPLFRSQRETGSISLTDRRMTRFWLTLEQAVGLVVECIGVMEGGEVFVPHIPSMRLEDMARAMAPDCELNYTGVRPGEKLHETLLSTDEARHSISSGTLFVIKPEFPWWGSNNWVDGTPLPEDFSFESGSNDCWLSDNEFLTLIGESSDVPRLSAAGR
jgi:UDP-N-acetylglucosamine 4,6-dehydratase (inverting)